MKQKLFNPFIQVAGGKALAIGIIALLVSSTLAGLLATRFDGAIDAHFGGSHPFYKPFVDSLIDVLSVALVFYVLALALAPGRTRFVDMIGTTVLARFPYILIPLMNIGNILGKSGEKIVESTLNATPLSLTVFESVYLIFTMVVTLLVVIWYVALLYKAYTVSSNLKGTKAVLSFIAGMLLAEIISSILIYLL